MGTDCTTATVFVKQKINLAWNTDPAMVCLGNMPTLTANVSPVAGYNYDWYNGHGAVGAPIFSGSASYKPAATGPYSIKITDIQSGIACSVAIFDFDVTTDVVGPAIIPTPVPLSIQCGDPNAFQLIFNWLAAVNASYTKSDGTIVNVVPTNDYAGITMACNTSLNVTFTATDQCGNPTSVVSQINIIDTQSPIFTSCPGNVTINADPNQCYASGATLGTAVATDNCSTPVVTNNAPAQLPAGANLITWTATDACGNITTCIQTVTVTDNIKPTITCPANVTQTALPGNCSLANVTIANPVTADNCAVVTQTWAMSGATTGSSPAAGINSASGQTFNVGVTTVTYTVKDAAGNTATCTFDVWIKDLVKPVFSSGCPADVTQATDPGQCSAILAIPIPAVTDPCGEGFTMVNSFNGTNNASGTYPKGVTSVTWTVTDVSGNVTTCIQTVTVTDNVLPTITCPANVTQTALPGNCSLANVIIANPVTADNCAVVTQTWAMSGATTGSSPAAGINSASGQTFNVGVTTVTYTVSDAAGNTASCSFDVWIKDLVKPVFSSGCPADVTQSTDAGQCSAVVAIPKPVVTDPCGEGFTMVNSFNGTDDASGTYPKGVTSVTWTVTDVSGNVTTCIQTVTVTDNVQPTITCPANVTQTALPGNCSLANVVIANPVTADNCAVVTQTWAMSGATTGSSPAAGINSVSGQTFNVGVTTVTYTVSDAAGNTASCSFDVWIKDLVKPVFSSGCPADVTQATDPGQCSAILAIPIPAVTDPCGEGFTMVNSFNGTNNASGTYPKGVTSVTWTVTDVSGNITTCIQTVTVTDNILPTITCPANVTQTALAGNCSLANVVIANPVTADNCAVTTQTWAMSGATTGSSPAAGINSVSGQTFNVGTTTVTYTVSDAAGNTASCSFDVWIKDLVKPVFSSGCPANVTQATDPGQCSAILAIPIPAVTDPCGEGFTMVNSFNGTDDASGTYPKGVTSVTWTVTDVSGNVTTCIQTVTVTDNTNPTITCPANVTQTALPGNCSLANVVIGNPVTADNCAVVTQTWAMSGATTGNSPAAGINSVSGQTFNVGVTTVTYTVSDAAGNTASCSFDVWIKDLVKPVFSSGCPADVTQSTDAGQCSAVVAIPKPVVTDPCGEGFTMVNSFNGTDDASGTYPKGVTSVTWTVTDVSGNITTCIQTVTVNDRVPQLTCPSDISMMADFEKLFTTNVPVPSPVYSDDCPGLTLTWSMNGATSGNSPLTGVNIFPSPYTFNQGITTIQYTLTDADGHSVSCSFTVTVLSKPDIDCQPDLTKNNDLGLCASTVDPGFPVKLAGGEPITYSWSMSGATPVSGTASGTGAITPNPYTFNVGVTTISWTATNLSGSDMCTQTITVSDNELPTFTAPAPFAFCVENLISAAIVSSLLQLNPTPDYFLFKSGSNALDVNPAGFSDNCTPPNQLVLHWRIDFGNATPPPSISGTGQPSAYGSDIIFPGDGATFLDVTHTITYWVVDLSGNESVHKPVTITIHPRPAFSYINQSCPTEIPMRKCSHQPKMNIWVFHVAIKKQIIYT